eukprot:CAMPEP_0206421348 /NCGR_PEP_ID=MMETSP0324_2-20121206/1391_1 /ASSEMBLY_ACC=CAM_ASM_000836 /TAXON_ID=2866 /ORGANISM="Crypthecodinium cohnii, Strain Seligo" /LENGTH=121 /DNA_ID=CAMNT_0053885419 /DNA_START=267 /DNA_END=633 /DNA_ORIENTATION=-
MEAKIEVDEDRVEQFEVFFGRKAVTQTIGAAPTSAASAELQSSARPSASDGPRTDGANSSDPRAEKDVRLSSASRGRGKVERSRRQKRRSQESGFEQLIHGSRGRIGCGLTSFGMFPAMKV